MKEEFITDIRIKELDDRVTRLSQQMDELLSDVKKVQSIIDNDINGIELTCDNISKTAEENINVIKAVSRRFEKNKKRRDKTLVHLAKSILLVNQRVDLLAERKDSD